MILVVNSQKILICDFLFQITDLRAVKDNSVFCYHFDIKSLYRSGPTFDLYSLLRNWKMFQLTGHAQKAACRLEGAVIKPGGVVSLVVCLGHRDVTKREARNFEEFSKMAPLPFPNATFKVGFPGY